MRLFASRSYTLSRLPYGARVFYTLFLALIFLGLLTCLAFPLARSGVGAGAVAEYYRQEQLGLGGKSFVELLETAHFHLFTMPVVVLVLAHIFFLGSWPERRKMVVVLASFAAVLGEVVLPFLIVYHTGAWAYALSVSRVLLVATFLIYIFVPIREMWWGDAHSRLRRRERPSGPPRTSGRGR